MAARRVSGRLAGIEGAPYPVDAGRVEAVEEYRVEAARPAGVGPAGAAEPQLGGLHDAIAWTAKDAKLGDNYVVRYVQPAQTPLQRILQGVGNSASVQVLTDLGLHLPKSWLLAVPGILPDLQFLLHAQTGKPVTYAYCFCRVQ